jgi:hypothetical protein
LSVFTLALWAAWFGVFIHTVIRLLAKAKKASLGAKLTPTAR